MRSARLFDFFGPKVARILVLSIIAGILLSAVEVSFAMLIQSFLVSMGTIDPNVANVPDWVPKAFFANLAFLAAFAFVRGAIQWFKVYSHAMVNESFAYHMRSRIIEWALLSGNSDSSRIVTYVNDRVTGAANCITAVQNTSIHALSLTLILIYLLKIAPVLAISGIGVLVAFGAALRLLDRHVKNSGNELTERSAAVNQRLLDSMKNLQFLRVCRAQERELSKIHADLKSLFLNTRLFSAIKSCKYSAPQFIGVLVIIAISYFNREQQALGGGLFVSFIYLFIRASQILAELSSSIASWRMYSPQMNELIHWWKRQYTQAPPRLKQPTSPAMSNLRPTSWTLQNVGFSYENKPILNRINLATNPGEITVITGASGSGKTTLLYLLAGVLEPKAGTIGTNSGDKSMRGAVEAHSRFGYVGPDPHVIGGTILENLVYGLDFAPSQDELKTALEKAHCLEFLANFPEDLNRRLSDRGEGLSAGQKQRLSLARALLRRPTALLLDEPTANLDSESAAVVTSALSALRGQISVVIVTHYKPLVGIADKVIDFEKTTSH
ncbi:MAG: ABC transporter ATP-binding protein [Bdellovibrionota bacterium]